MRYVTNKQLLHAAEPRRYTQKENMKIPPLDRTDRSREYNSYSTIIRANVIYLYLFEGLSHRAIDEKVIGLDSTKSKGWQSMGILHFLGLKKPHKNIFNGINTNTAIASLLEIGTNDASLVASYIEKYENQEVLDKDTFEREFLEEIRISKQKGKQLRQSDLSKTEDKIPEQVEVISIAFRRNPDVVVAVLERASGFCETCHLKAPFLRARDNSPYLEVHHVVRLADGGKDNVGNAIALCPNCHREAHYGVSTDV